MNDDFQVIGEITDVETIAVNKSIREVRRLRKMFGRGRWRKRKGRATVRLPDGVERRAEVHSLRSSRHRQKETQNQTIFGLNNMADQTNETPRFAICINHGGYPESLEPLKIYQVLPDPEAAQHRQMRVIDESGEDYLYFEELFIRMDFPVSVEIAMSRAALSQY